MRAQALRVAVMLYTGIASTSWFPAWYLDPFCRGAFGLFLLWCSAGYLFPKFEAVNSSFYPPEKYLPLIIAVTFISQAAGFQTGIQLGFLLSVTWNLKTASYLLPFLVAGLSTIPALAIPMYWAGASLEDTFMLRLLLLFTLLLGVIPWWNKMEVRK